MDGYINKLDYMDEEKVMKYPIVYAFVEGRKIYKKSSNLTKM